MIVIKRAKVHSENALLSPFCQSARSPQPCIAGFPAEWSKPGIRSGFIATLKVYQVYHLHVASPQGVDRVPHELAREVGDAENKLWRGDVDRQRLCQVFTFLDGRCRGLRVRFCLCIKSVFVSFFIRQDWFIELKVLWDFFIRDDLTISQKIVETESLNPLL